MVVLPEDSFGAALPTGDHQIGYYRALRLHVLEGVEGVQIGVDAFVFPFKTAGDTNVHRVVGHGITAHVPCHLLQYLTRFLALVVELLAFCYKIGLEAVWGNDIHGLVKQLLALARCDVAHRGEAVCLMSRLALG